MSKTHTQILGVNISAIKYESALKKIEFWIRRGIKKYVCVSAVHLVMECQKDKELLNGVNKAGMVTPDGMPLVWLSKLYGRKNVSRVYGPDLMLKLCELAEQKKYRVLIFGGGLGQSKKVNNFLMNKFPKIKVFNYIDCPDRPPSEIFNNKVIKQINKTKAHIVFVGLGCPYQEKWMIENRKKLNANVLIGVGAAFDFFSGRVKQAPVWLQNIGLEWLYRLYKEPRRLWYRYTVLNLIFTAKICRQLIRDLFSSSFRAERTK